MSEATRTYAVNGDAALGALAARWQAFRDANPKTRIRDAAAALGVSEAELLATQIGREVTVLRPACVPLFEAFGRLGPVMASTRNEWAVIEKDGTFDNVDIGEKMGVVLNHEIDLRIFVDHYNCAYAVLNEDHSRGPLRSVQFFDRAGDSIHKVYVRDGGDVAAWEALVEEFRVDAPRELSFAPPAKAPYERPADFDREAFRAAWLAMQDTHDFFGIVRAHGLSRLDAFRNAPEGHGVQVRANALQTVLETARDREIPIMVFVGSRGCLEIHTGPLRRVVEMDTWLNVLDPGFNLHVQRAGIREGWIVRKPTADGIVTSVEFFDHDDQLVLMTFGGRKPGIPELESWRDLVAELEARAHF